MTFILDEKQWRYELEQANYDKQNTLAFGRITKTCSECP